MSSDCRTHLNENSDSFPLAVDPSRGNGSSYITVIMNRRAWLLFFGHLALPSRASKPRNPCHFAIIEGGRVYLTLFVQRPCFMDISGAKPLLQTLFGIQNVSEIMFPAFKKAGRVAGPGFRPSATGGRPHAESPMPTTRDSSAAS